MKLSLSGFLFEDDYASQSVSFERFCEIAASAGYEGVELRRTQITMEAPAQRRSELLRIARDAGLAITCLTVRYSPKTQPQRDAYFLRHLQLCADLECGLLKTGGDPAWREQMAERALEFGVTLASNNHVGSQRETVAGTRQFFAESPHANYGLLYDSMHLRVSGEDYVGCIEEFYPRVRNILMHSLRPAERDEDGAMEISGRYWNRALPDAEGVQDWPAIFRAFRRLGYDGLVTVIEAGWPSEQREDIARRCARTLKDLWLEAGPGAE